MADDKPEVARAVTGMAERSLDIGGAAARFREMAEQSAKAPPSPPAGVLGPETPDEPMGEDDTEGDMYAADEGHQDNEHDSEIEASADEADESEKAGDEDDPAEKAKPSDADDDADDVVTLDADALANLIGIESDLIRISDEGKVTFRTKIDGKPQDATLADLVKSYQLDATLTNRGKSLAERSKQLDSQYEQFQANTSQMVQQLAATMQALEQQYQQGTESIDWKALREEDPSEYAARRAEMGERKEQLTQVRQSIIDQIQQAQQAQQQAQAQYLATKLEQESKSLESAIKAQNWPKWDALRPQLVDYLSESYGFTGKELEGIYDHRLLVMAQKARLYDEGARKLKGKQLKALPKVMRPGTRPAKGQADAQKFNASRSALKKSGSVDDAAAVFRAMRKR